MQWRGLWHLFARHGEVTRAYIARKLSGGDKRFGFVDFKCETAVVCSTQYIARRLEEWGLNGISIRRMGGKSFFLSFEGEDLFIMLEDLDWSYLKEIFQRIKVWSEKSRSHDRATWIKIRGVPLHAWNVITLKRIAAVWGNFEAWGKEEETASKITIGRLVGFQFDLRTFLSSGKKDNNYDSRCLMERAAVLEKEVNLEGADKQLEENEEVKESHCEVEKAGCVQFFEVGGRSSIDVGKGIAKKTWAEVLVDQCPTQSLAQNESSPDLGPHSINTLSKANAGLEVGGGYLEPGLLGHHLNKELTQLEVVQSPDPIEGTGREVVLSSLDNFGELETFSPKVRSKRSVE
ncbi:hypothetical protein V6N13_083609 [Hibiscus sabdariffa]